MARVATAKQARVELAARLSGRRLEIEQAVMARVYGVANPPALDPAYADALRAAVRAAVDYGLENIERGEERPPPPVLLVQARLAVRAGVSLDIVLRRYFAGYALLSHYLVEEAGVISMRGADMQRLLRFFSMLFERLVATVGEEYAREKCGQAGSSRGRQVERIERLLAGELVDPDLLEYNLEHFHLGCLAMGRGVAELLRDLAASLNRRYLGAPPQGDVVWVWLGGHQPLDPEILRKCLAPELAAGTSLAIGEPGEGLAGWRLTHRQAKAAFIVASRATEKVVRYADVALLASIVQDDVLTISLHELYLRPLESSRDGGKMVRETLRAYFEADRNVSSTAAALKVSRPTVASRLQAIEKTFGCSLSDAALDLEAALSLDRLLRYQQVSN